MSVCSSGFMNDQNMSCVTACQTLLDPTTNRCVAICPFNSFLNTALYANHNIKLCVIADDCPNNTYASDDLLTCVSACPSNTFIHLKRCVAICHDDFYINYDNKSCVSPTNCPLSHFANNQTLSCVSSCTNGTYADTLLRQCIYVCYGLYYGDPITKACTLTCSTGLVKNL